MKQQFPLDFLELLRAEGFGTAIGAVQVSGGSINEAFRLDTDTGAFFLKRNSATRFPNMFEAEATGLKLLSRSTFKVPQPLLITESQEIQYILMDWVEEGPPTTTLWLQFGTSLANMHSLTTRFGLDHDNYIGSLPQSNRGHESWWAFYREERLLPQLKLAESNGRLTASMAHGFDALFKHLDQLFPEEPPALLHGDLWSGNFMVSSDGQPCIFDPAVYYGHREMDLAMMALFGGFGNGWVQAYNEVYPLESGWHERIPIGQLYPLMVHVNLFGGGYVSDVENILQKFI